MTDCAVWMRVSTEDQSTRNQEPDIDTFAKARGLNITSTYVLHDSAWKNGGGEEYRMTLKRLLDDAWQGKFSVVVVWALDRIVRAGAEDALRIVRQLRERGCTLISVKESWLNGSSEVQDVLLAFAGWLAQQESQRRSERVRAGIQRRMAEDPTFRPGRQAGARDRKPRRRSGYYARQERLREMGGAA